MPATPIPYPKWVAVHATHIHSYVRGGQTFQVTPGWTNTFIDRNGTVWVLVQNAGQETIATSVSA